jgi:hypothetical protein
VQLLKVDVPNPVAYLNWTPIFEWHVVWCGSGNGYVIDMCLRDIGMGASKSNNHFRSNSQHNWGGVGGPIQPFREH